MTILVLFAVTALILSKKCVLIGAKIVVRQERGRAGRSDGGANFCLITIHPSDPPAFLAENNVDAPGWFSKLGARHHH